MSKVAKTLRKLALMRAKEREGTFQARAQRREQDESLEKAIEQQNKKAMKEEELFEERSHGERRYVPSADRISTADARGRLHSLAEQFLKMAEAGKETDANNLLSQMPKLLKEAKVTKKLKGEIQTFAESAKANLELILKKGNKPQRETATRTLNTILTQLLPDEAPTEPVEDMMSKYPTLEEIAEEEARARAIAEAEAEAEAIAQAEAHAKREAKAKAKAEAQAKKEAKAKAKAEAKARKEARKNTPANKRATANTDAVLMASSPELQSMPAAAASSGYVPPRRLRFEAPPPAHPSPGLGAVAREEFGSPEGVKTRASSKRKKMKGEGKTLIMKRATPL